MKNASVVIKMNAGRDDVIVDGHVFDRSTLDRPQRNKLRRMIVAAFEKDHRG